ncbi:MAG: hypothetical protein J1F32_00530 [Erysipelotrichales bacterium]|nr:hypothetical protein [Erysipelotrichales bacterium]
MKKLIKWFDEAPLLIKIVFALPALDIVWVVYRIFRSYLKNNMLGVVLGVILVIVGIPWLWLVDIITLLLNGKVIWFND